MPYLNLDPAYPRHPKARRLKAILGPEADVYPIRMWSYLAEAAPETGSFEDLSAAEVEAVLEWRGAPGALVAALMRTGLLDEALGGSYASHNWAIHEGHLRAYKERARRANQTRWGLLVGPPRDARKDSSKESSKDSLEESPIPAVPALPTKTTPPTPQGGEATASRRQNRPGRAPAAASAAFAAWYAIYPRKQARRAAERAWAKLAPDAALVAALHAALEAQKRTSTWARAIATGDYEHVPHPASWLNGRRWEDAVPAGNPAMDGPPALRDGCYEPRTAAQRLVCAYKLTRDIALADAGWDAANWAAAEPWARHLLDAFGGQERTAAAWLEAFGGRMRAEGLSWTLKTAAQKAWDEKGERAAGGANVGV